MAAVMMRLRTVGRIGRWRSRGETVADTAASFLTTPDGASSALAVWYPEEEFFSAASVSWTGDAPSMPTEAVVAAEACLARGDLVSARAHVDAAVDAFRRSADEWGLADALAVRGAVARAGGDFTVAAANYRKALSIFHILDDLPSTVRLYHALAETRFTERDYAAAADLHREALTLVPGDVASLTGLGYSEWYAGHIADALTVLTEALSRDLGNRVALSAKGQILADLGRAGPALECLDRASSMESDRRDEADIRSARGLALGVLGKDTDADAELSAARRLDPSRAWTHLRTARILLRRHDTAQAVAELHAALSAKPPLPAAHEEIARRFLAELPALSL